MTTTITLDDDVAITVREEIKWGNGKTFKAAVNDLIRSGRYATKKGDAPAKRFVVKAKNLGTFPHINYDKASELLAMLDEEEYR